MHITLSWIDWAIMIVAVIALRLVSLSTRSHMKSVADFLSANRSAGRYLLTIAQQMGNTGTVAVVALFEVYSSAGFPPVFWSLMTLPVTVIMVLTGWVLYRFRETRAMTMAQFLEMRYNRRFRIYAGILAFTAGILNFGIFPAVAARFLMYFCGLPLQFHLPWIPIDISTFATIMALDLVLALVFVNMGGQVSVMVTECVQGIFTGIVFVVISAAVLIQIRWPDMVRAMNAAPPEASMLNPFHTSKVKDFNVWFFLIGLFAMFYTRNAWQGAQGFLSSPRTPHEAKMGAVIQVWRDAPKLMMAVVLSIAAYAVLHLPEYTAQVKTINATLSTIDNETIRTQMQVPVTLANILPVGIKGLLATCMLFFSFTCHDTYMHSWGSIFIQDVVLPIRNRAFTPEQHIKYLRWAIIGVAVFSFFFGLLFKQTEYILMYFAITGTIWLGGAGSVIVGGLYWRKGTTPAAYAALTTGAVIGVSGLIIPKIYLSHYHQEFPINGQWLYLFGMLSAIVVYVVISLITSRGWSYNLEGLLHRGQYAVAEDRVVVEERQSKWQQVLGITKEFSLFDKIMAVAFQTWNLGWFAFFIVATVLHYTHVIPNSWWPRFWYAFIVLYLVISIPTTIWFTVGGLIDIKLLYKHLAALVRNHEDDGRVIQAPTTAPEPAIEPELEPVPDES